MERVSIVGCPGSGKTTLARELARRLDLFHLELDSIFHQPGWQPLPRDEYRRRVEAALAASPRWVCDGNYRSGLGGLVQSLADTVVWLHPPRSFVMRRVVARTLRRAVTREELWNGNREPFTNFYRWNPEKNVMRWAWVHHPIYRSEYGRCSRDGEWSHLTVVRLDSQHAIDEWLRDVLGPDEEAQRRGGLQRRGLG